LSLLNEGRMPQQHDASSIRKFLKDSVTYAVSGAATTFIGVVMVPIYTRMFSPAEYGALDLISSLTALLILFLLLGQPSAVGRFYVDAKDARDARVSASTSGFFLLLTSLVVAALILIFYRGIAQLLHGTPQYSSAVALALCAVPFMVQFRFLQNLLKWRQEPMRYAGLSIASLVIGLSVTIYLVVIAKLGITGVFAATLVNSVLFCCLGLFMVRTSLSITFSWGRLRELMSFGLPMIALSMSYYFLTFSSRYIIRYFLDLDDVGMYAIGVRVASVLALLLNGFQMAMGPFVYSHYEDDGAKETFSKTFDYVSVATVLAVTGLALFAGDVVNKFATPDYLPGHKVVPLLAAGTAAYGLGAYFSFGIGISKKTIHKAWTGGVAAVLNVILSWFLVPVMGIYGAALATCVSFAVLAVLQMWWSQKLWPVPYRFGRNFVMYAVATAIIVFAYLSDLSRPGLGVALPKIGLLGLVFASAVAVGLIRKREFRFAVRVIKRAFGAGG
jgi:O-antigen/teichoic acid export membrane protein